MEESMDKKINRLKIIIAENDSSGIALAAYLKKDRSTVSQWVSNKRQPTLLQLTKIAEYYNINIQDLLYPSTPVPGESIAIRHMKTLANKSPVKKAARKKVRKR